MYRVLSPYYDRLFGEEPVILSFLKEQFPPNAFLLDAGCGTGTYAAALGRSGYSVLGIDSDDAMIDIARGKPHPDRVRYLRAGLEEHGRYGGEPFDGIYCIGNTLPHLADRRSLAGALRAFRAALHTGDRLLIQTVNMDRALRHLPYRLSDLEGEHVAMERLYLAADNPDRLIFRTVLTVRDDAVNQRLENRIPLLAVRRDELAAIAADAGFTDQRWFGSYGGDLWSVDAPLTILAARGG